MVDYKTFASDFNKKFQNNNSGNHPNFNDKENDDDNGRKKSFYARIGAVQALFSENLIDVECSLEPDNQKVNPEDPCFDFNAMLNTYANDVLFYTETDLGNGNTDEEIISRAADKRLLREIVKGVISNQYHIDKFIMMLNIEDWEKMDRVFACVLRSAIYEILYRKKTPKIVAISEYTRVTDWFFGKSKAKFTNALLDKIVNKLKCPEDADECYIEPEDMADIAQKSL
ncbi:MAG: transcription antitermination protein NusB [Rickettsiales bacterium]|nr:transcription antitermination protein NusB [Rickettsiales bacterium]